MQKFDDPDLLACLKRAIEANDIKPHFQPIVEMESGTLLGFEVLARWTADIGPAIFIPMAENAGLIEDLTVNLIAQACETAANWQLLSEAAYTLSLNISPLQFRSIHKLDLILATIRRSRFPIERIKIEITEGALFPDTEKSLAWCRHIKSLGMKLVLDDFGTGYSSLERLQALPVDELKIDASFVRTMLSQRSSRKIVAAVIGLARSLGIGVVAEGIETQQQAEVLRKLGCHVGQGWLFGRPVHGHDSIGLLKSANRLSHSFVPRGPREIPPDLLAAQFDALYAAAPVALCFLDRDLRYVSANSRLAELQGCEVESLIGRKINDVLPSLTNESLSELYAVLSGVPTEPKEISPSWDARKTLLVTPEAVRDELDEIIGIALAIVDVSALKYAEQALLESDENFRCLLELSPHIPWIADAEGRFLYVSPRYLASVGMTLEEMQTGWLRLVHPDDVSRVADNWRRAINTCKIYDVELRQLNTPVNDCPAGSWRPMRSYAVPRLNPEGKALRWFGILEYLDSRNERFMEIGEVTTSIPGSQ